MTNSTLILDVETANDIHDALVYDIGGHILEEDGTIHSEFSFVIRDIFCDERDIMKSAYYASKIPEYVEDLQNERRQMVNFMYAYRFINHLMKVYNCKTVAAYNCSFDRNALNVTLRYLTKSEYRWFFPYDTEFICIWNMACNSICQDGNYRTFTETYRHYSNHGKNYRATAEIVYAYLTNNPDYQEEHKGLDDVKIETEIYLACLAAGCEKMGIKRNCWQKVKRGAIALR